MKLAFYKATAWMWAALGVALGTSAMLIAEEREIMEPLFFVIIGYGLAYIILALWRQFRGKLLAIGIAVFLIISYFSNYSLVLYYLLTGQGIEMDKFWLWALNLIIFGVPIMFVVFRRYR